MKGIKIVTLPAGDIPLAVRAAWVGLVMPLAEPQKRTIRSAGVLNGPRSYFTYLRNFLTGNFTSYEGYVVESAVAIAILAVSDPEAGQWWKAYSPQFLKPGRKMLFLAENCEEAEVVVWPPPPRAAGEASRPEGER